MKKKSTAETSECPRLLPKLTVDTSYIKPSCPDIVSENQKPQINGIEDPLECQKQFLQTVGISIDRPLRIYPKLICKPDFIIHYISKCQSIESLEMLIADQITLFSPEFTIYQYYHAHFQKEHIPQPQKNQALIHSRCLAAALYQVKKAENRSLFEKILNSFSADTQACLKPILEIADNLTTYWREIPEEGESKLLLERANDLIPHAGLTEDTIVPFVYECLWEYRHAYNDITLINKEPTTGHYKPQYTDIDFRFARNYIVICQYFKEKRKDFVTSWSTIKYPFKTEESFSSLSDPGCQIKFTPSVYSQVKKSICQYFIDSTQRGCPELPAAQVEFIIRKLEQNYKEMFPFRAMVLCVVKGGIFLKTRSQLEMKEILEFSNNVYRKKPSVPIQRVNRLKLLFSLCDACELKREDIECNVSLFIKYHGAVPQSEKEFALWDRFLQKHNLMNSFVSLPFYYASALKECLPLQFEKLNCFESCSAIHHGGFSAFAKYAPAVLQEYTSMEHQETIPKTLRYEYLIQWASENLNIDAMKDICLKIEKKLDWSHLEGLDEWIDQEKFGVPLKHIDLNELKLLLSEIAVQSSLLKEAKKLLHQSLTNNESIWRKRVLKRSRSNNQQLKNRIPI